MSGLLNSKWPQVSGQAYELTDDEQAFSEGLSPHMKQIEEATQALADARRKLEEIRAKCQHKVYKLYEETTGNASIFGEERKSEWCCIICDDTFMAYSYHR